MANFVHDWRKRDTYACCVTKLVIDYVGGARKGTVGYRYRYPTGINTAVLRLLYNRIVYDFKNCRKIVVYLGTPVGVKIGANRLKIATIACRLPKCLPIGLLLS